jgi:uncharacterized pyridoxamine 5'-phosphate oxidase family protein
MTNTLTKNERINVNEEIKIGLKHALFVLLSFLALLAIFYLKSLAEAKDDKDYIIKTSQSKIYRLIEDNCITLITYSSELNLDESLNELVNNQYLKLKHKLSNEQQLEVKKLILKSLKHLVNEDKELINEYIQIVNNN